MTTPLHLLAFALSPRFYSQPVLKESATRVAPYKDPKVAHGYKAALQRLFLDHIQPTMRSEFTSFASTDDCGHEALEDKSNVDAHKWWYFHGQTYQHLQPIAIKILSQRAELEDSIAHFDALALDDSDHELPSDVEVDPEVEPNIASTDASGTFVASNMQQQNDDDLFDDFG